MLLNLVTNSVLCKNTYFVVYNMMTKKLSQRIAVIQKRMHRLDGLIPQDLKVPPVLSMDLELWMETFPQPRPHLEIPFVPFSRTIENIQKVRGIESMVVKLEYVYRLFTRVLTSEISEFWQGDRYFKSNDKYVDPDNLRAIIIYVIIKAKCVKVLVGKFAFHL